MTTPNYLRLLKGGVYARMFALKNIVTESTAGNRPPSHRVADWRAARVETFATLTAPLDQGYNVTEQWALGKKSEKRTPVWYSHAGPQFRNECDAHEVQDMRMDHTGWFCDEDCDNMAIGIVGQLSHGRYVAGYRCTMNDERVYFGTVYTDAKEAATAGDEAARIYAEREQEYNARYNAAHRINDDIEEAKTDAARLIALRHHPKLGASARDSLECIFESIRDKRAELKNDYSDIEF